MQSDCYWSTLWFLLPPEPPNKPSETRDVSKQQSLAGRSGRAFAIHRAFKQLIAKHRRNGRCQAQKQSHPFSAPALWLASHCQVDSTCMHEERPATQDPAIHELRLEPFGFRCIGLGADDGSLLGTGGVFRMHHASNQAGRMRRGEAGRGEGRGWGGAHANKTRGKDGLVGWINAGWDCIVLFWCWRNWWGIGLRK